MLLSKAQQARFWRLWSKAERESLPPTATRYQRNELRRNTIREACGTSSLKQVRRGDEYDKVMLAVALLAHDYEEAAHFSAGSERRFAKLMVVCARQIGEIVGVTHSWDYCRSTLRQAGLPSSWEDVPESLLAATFAMLDTHRRRLLKRDHGWRGGRRYSETEPLAFNIDRRYYYNDTGVLQYADDTNASVSTTCTVLA